MIIAELVFSVAYLITIWTFVALMTLRGRSVAAAELPIARRIRWAFTALATGDPGQAR